jgi:UDP-N-acetylglucosamine 2-epimerase (non-hydrolysing)
VLKKRLGVSVVLGTRPEAIKLLPVVAALRECPDIVACRLVSTGQHRELVDQVFEAFDVQADTDLRLMEPGQALETSFARVLLGMTEEFKAHRPDLVLVEGDTTSVVATALAAFWRGCPVGHVEAGLRSGNRRNPFPEEMNRTLAGCMADLHFAPTRQAAANLRQVGVPESAIFVTGNTVIDALLSIARKVKGLPAGIPLAPASRLLLVTVHRRESFGEPLAAILAALAEIVRLVPDVEIVLPVHPNPKVHGAVYERLGGIPRIHLVQPVKYADFVALLRAAYLILSDSGGVQEEAPALGKPVLVLRETTERPEGVAAGVARLVGTSTPRIIQETTTLLNDAGAYRAMARPVDLYGDGRASWRIVQAIRHHFGLSPERPDDFSPLLTSASSEDTVR